MTNNNKTKAKINTTNVSLPIPIKLLGFLLKKGQYIVPNNIADQYAHIWSELVRKMGLKKVWKKFEKETKK